MPPVPAARIEQMIAQANGLAANGKYYHAARLLEDAVALAPRSADAHHALAWTYKSLGEPLKAAESARKAVALAGTRAESHYLLGTILQITGPAEEAIKCYERAMALKPSMADPYGGAASVYERSSQPAKARQVIERGLKHIPGDPQLRAIHAGIRMREGELEAARDDLRELVKMPVTDREVPAFARAWHTLGLTLDKLGDFDGAFEAHTRCNLLQERMPQARWALANDTITPAIRAQSRLTREQFERWMKEEPEDGRPSPAFLVGFPRSGTTLTEQVLGAHPRVVATPERQMLLGPLVQVEDWMRLGVLPGAPRGAGEEADLSAALDALTRDQLRELRAQYWRGAEREYEGGLDGRLLVDKYPVHVGRLGFINRVFPRSRVLVAIRDPRDCCLSAYVQYFVHNPAMVKFLRLESTAAFYADLMGLYLTLRDRLTTPVLPFRYEDTVADPEGQARRQLEFLGLEWDDRVLRPEDRAKSRYVNTPSWMTTGTKINAGAKGRWTKYRKHLEPILAGLEPFVKEFGYASSFEAADAGAGAGAGAAEGASEKVS